MYPQRPEDVVEAQDGSKELAERQRRATSGVGVVAHGDGRNYFSQCRGRLDLL